jgi:hypothetical protein
LENEKTPSDAESADKPKSGNERLLETFSAFRATAQESHSEIKGIRAVIESQSTAIDSLIDVHEEVIKLYAPLLEDPAQVETLFPFLINVIEAKLQFHYVVSRTPETGDPVDPTWMQVVERVPVRSGSEFDVVTRVITPSYKTTVNGQLKRRRDARVIATESNSEKTASTDGQPVEPSEPPDLFDVNNKRFSAVQDKLFIVTVFLSFLLNIVLFAFVIGGGENTDSAPNINQSIPQSSSPAETPNSEATETESTPAPPSPSPEGESKPTPKENSAPEEDSDEVPLDSN